MADLIGIEIEGIPEVRARLKLLDSNEPKSEMTQEVGQYVRKELQKYAAPKSVTRKQAYGVTFFTQRQRRFFFAALRQGTIQVPYRRTRSLMEGWKIEKFGAIDHLVINEQPHAAMVQQRSTQSRMMKIIGWSTIEGVVERGADKIRNIANMVYDRYIRRIGL